MLIKNIQYLLIVKFIATFFRHSHKSPPFHFVEKVKFQSFTRIAYPYLHYTPTLYNLSTYFKFIQHSCNIVVLFRCDYYFTFLLIHPVFYTLLNEKFFVFKVFSLFYVLSSRTKQPFPLFYFLIQIYSLQYNVLYVIILTIEIASIKGGTLDVK